MRARNTQLTIGLEPKAGDLWRPVHYLGSKLRLASRIREIVASVVPGTGTVCDLFAGSGTAALALAIDRPVVASDIQEYSRVLCSALLRPAAFTEDEANSLTAATCQSEIEAAGLACLAPLLVLEADALSRLSTAPTLVCDLVESGGLVDPSACCNRELRAALISTANSLNERGIVDRFVVTKFFGGAYFSFSQAFELDVLLHRARTVRVDALDAAIAAVLSTASDVVNTVGKHFAQPLKLRRPDGSIKTHLLPKVSRDRSINVRTAFSSWIDRYSAIKQHFNHQVLCGDYREVLKRVQDVQLFYADPPYTRDHYSRFYHVLETIARGDQPTVSTTLLSGEGSRSRGGYRQDRHQSPFCIKSKAPDAFDALFSGTSAKGSPVLLSYSPFVRGGHPRLMTVDSIRRIAARYYTAVEVIEAGEVVHSKLNKAELHLEAAESAEVFIVCTH